MKKFFKTAIVFFLIFVFSFSFLAKSVFAVSPGPCVGLDCDPSGVASTIPAGSTDVSGAIGSVSATTKTPFDQAVEKCEDPAASWGLLEVFKAGSCLVVNAAVIGLTSYEAVGEVVEGVETAIEDKLKIFDLTVTGIFAKIVVLISQIVGFIVAQEMYLMVFFMSPDTFQYATFPAVQAGFYVALQIANGLLALGLVILANKFILGMESYSNLQSLTRYLVTALLINFSLVMASYIVGVSNFLTIAFLNQANAPITGGTTENYATRLMATMNQLSEVFSGLVTIDGDLVQTTVANITTILVLIIFSLFLIMILAAIIVSLLTRVIALWTLMMVVPLAIAADTVFSGLKIPGIPVGSGNFDKWLGSFIKWVSFGPIMAGVIWFVFLVLGQADFAFAQAWANDPNIGIIMATLGKTFTLLIAMMLLYQGYVFAHSSSSGVPKFVDGAVRNVFSYGEKGLQFTGKRGLTKFGAGLADSKAGVWTQRHVPFVGGLLTKAGKYGKKLRTEDQADVKSRWEHMHEVAKGEARKKAIAKQAVLEYKDTRDPKLLGFILSNDDAKEAFLADYAAEKSAGVDRTNMKQVAKAHQTVEKDMAAMAQQAQQSGINLKDAGVEKLHNEIYKQAPILAGKDFDDFAKGMSGKDMAELNEESLVDTLLLMNQKRIDLSVNQINNLIDGIGGSSEKEAIVIPYIELMIARNPTLGKGVGKNAQSVWWINKNCNAATAAAL